MTLYVDTSALLKRYLDEPDSEFASTLLEADDTLVTARHTVVEGRRTLAQAVHPEDHARVREAFIGDLRSFAIIELDPTTCELAATVAEVTGARTLDALHLAAAQRVASPGLGFVTFDVRQAQAARALGLTVLGTPDAPG